MSSVHPVGFSLGAQVAGHLGYKLNGKLSRITGKSLSEALLFAEHGNTMFSPGLSLKFLCIVLVIQ